MEVEVVELSEKEKLAEVASKTKVLISTCGPYLKHGFNVVEACVKSGAHYCDITGEAPFFKAISEKWHKEAEEKRLKIVSFCGFDCVPSEVAVHQLAQLAKEKYGEKLSSVEGYYTMNGGGLSGGTVASVFNIFELPLKELQKLSNPFYLSSKHKEASNLSGKSTNSILPRYSKDILQWTSPSFFSGVNEQVVRKSNELLDFEYGEKLDYGESLTNSSFFSALLVTLFSLFVTLLILIPPLRRIKAFLPKQGEGPSLKKMERSSVKALFIAKTRGGKKLGASVWLKKDAGYLETSKMISECALLLLKGEGNDKFGVITPSVAFGSSLPKRLNEVDIEIEAFLMKNF